MRNSSKQMVPLVFALAFTGCGLSPPTALTGTLDITSPGNDSTVNLPLNNKIAVNFTTNYTLKAAGQCMGQEGCGYVDVFIDSTNCNAPGMRNNNTAVVSPAEANFSYCATARGMHTIRLELHHDDNSVVNGLAGDPITSSVVVIGMSPF